MPSQHDNDRFDARTRQEGDCLLWTGALANGYGAFSVGGQTRGAHRYAYERWIGPIPQGLDIDHLCRVRHCVNPAHLEAVTRAENLRRGINHHAIKTHCPYGHPYDEINTYRKNGHRVCRICGRRRGRVRNQRRAAVRVG